MQHFTQRNTAPYTMLALRIDHAELRTDRADIHHCSPVLSQQSMMTVDGIDIEYPLASWWRRFAATAIDIGLFIGGLHLSYHAFWPFAWLVGPGAGTVAAGAVFACSFVWQSVVYRWISPGQTPGKWVMSLQVLRQDGRPVTAFDISLEVAAKYFGTVLLFLDQLCGLTNVFGHRRCLHNWACGTVVVHKLNSNQLEKQRSD